MRSSLYASLKITLVHKKNLESQFLACLCNVQSIQYTVPKEIVFPRYNMKCSWENVILRGIYYVVSRFSLHVILRKFGLFFLQCT